MLFPLLGSPTPLARGRTAAAAAAATLAALRGCRAAWHSDSLIYTNTTGTTPAAGDGTSVQLIKDQSGNGKDLTFYLLAPTIQAGANLINGQQSLKYVDGGTSGTTTNNHTILDSSFNTSFTVHLAYKSHNDGSLRVIALWGTNGYIGDRNNTTFSCYFPPVLSGELAVTLPVSTGGVNCASVRYNGTTFEIWANGTVLHSSAKSGSQGFTSGNFFQIGTYNGGGFRWSPGRLRAMGLYNVYHSDSEMRAGQRILHRLWNQPVNYRLLVVGDSISVNVPAGGSNWTTKVTAAQVAAGYLYQLYNASHAGYTIDDSVHSPLSALQSSEVNPNFHWITGPNWDETGHMVLLTAGSNDLLYGASDTTTLSRQVAYANSVRSYLTSQGYTAKIGVSTILDRTDFNATQKSYRNAYNTALRTALPSAFDFLLDFAANANLGADGAAASTTYFLDGVHPTDAGYALMRDIAVPVVQAQDPY